MIDIDDSMDEVIKIVTTEWYSRIPVYRWDRDSIIGVLLYQRPYTKIAFLRKRYRPC